MVRGGIGWPGEVRAARSALTRAEQVVGVEVLDRGHVVGDRGGGGTARGQWSGRGDQGGGHHAAGPGNRRSTTRRSTAS